MLVQKKNLVRVIRYMADQIEMHEPERIEAENVTENCGMSMLTKVSLQIGTSGLFRIDILYPNKEDK